MSRWKQWVSPPEGALPGGIVTKAGVVLIAVLVGGLLFSWAVTGPEEATTAPGVLPEAQAVDDGMGRSLQNRIRAEAERQAQQAAARAELERRQAAATEEMARLQTESETPNTAALIPGVSAAESELREALRLEELERRTRSLLALPVAHTFRTPDATTGPFGAESRGTEDTADADVAVLENTVQAALASFEQSGGALEEELEAEERLLAALGATAPAPNAGAAAPPSSPRTPGTAEPGRSVRPADPPGWERIYEGSFLEGVLLTQLTGDFPGPVLAMVSVPFYSADRQRILIPRGARVVGTARAVRDPDQSRLAVAFHRLLLPDGSWIDLEFTGLNQAGEGALRDQVDRHYFSTFAAAGAIGVVSGPPWPAVRRSASGRASAKDSARARPRFSTGS